MLRHTRLLQCDRVKMATESWTAGPGLRTAEQLQLLPATAKNLIYFYPSCRVRAGRNTSLRNNVQKCRINFFCFPSRIVTLVVCEVNYSARRPRSGATAAPTETFNKIPVSVLHFPPTLPDLSSFPGTSEIFCEHAWKTRFKNLFKLFTNIFGFNTGSCF